MDSNASDEQAAPQQQNSDKLRQNRSFSTNGFNSQDPLQNT